MTRPPPTIEKLRKGYRGRAICWCTGACKTGPCVVEPALDMTLGEFSDEMACLYEGPLGNPERAAQIRSVVAPYRDEWIVPEPWPLETTREEYYATRAPR